MPKQIRKTTILNWAEIHSQVKLVNKELTDIVDEINPDKSYKLIKAEYLYGDDVIKHGLVQIPTPKEILSIHDVNTDQKIKSELSYQDMPLFLVLTKTNEMFIDTGHRIVPLNVFNQGWISGVYEFMDFINGLSMKYNWGLSAGVRSIFMLPRITDQVGLNRLSAKYNIPSSLLVKKLTDHFALFKALAQSDNFEQEWKNEILFFSRKWFDTKNDSPAWQKFRNYLIKQSWLQAQYSILKINFAMEWEKYAEAITARRLHPKLYIIDQLKHILAVAKAYYPAFIPTDNSQESAPTDGIKRAIIETYLLKEYFPTMMKISSVKNLRHEQPVYYSLSMPTLNEGSPLKKNSSTILEDIRQIKLLIETLQKYLKLRGDSILQNIHFEYFHTDEDKQGEIELSSKIFASDKHFLQDEKLTFNKNFCATSPFFRGCIRIKS